MSRNRRAQLARELTHSTEMTYRQALAALEAHTAAGRPLPRTAAELASVPTATHTPAPHPVHAVAELTSVTAYVIRFSDVGRCPIGSLAPAHFLPDGACVHDAPQCPTCGGTGQLLGAGGLVTCSAANVSVRVPVCEGAGTWHGAWAGHP